MLSAGSASVLDLFLWQTDASHITTVLYTRRTAHQVQYSTVLCPGRLVRLVQYQMVIKLAKSNLALTDRKARGANCTSSI